MLAIFSLRRLLRNLHKLKESMGHLCPMKMVLSNPEISHNNPEISLSQICFMKKTSVQVFSLASSIRRHINSQSKHICRLPELLLLQHLWWTKEMLWRLWMSACGRYKTWNNGVMDAWGWKSLWFQSLGTIRKHIWQGYNQHATITISITTLICLLGETEHICV